MPADAQSLGMKLVDRFGLQFAAATSVLLLLGLCGWVSAASDDLLRAYTQREMHDNVREFAVPDARAASSPGSKSETGDFDGDGVADDLVVEWCSREPLVGRMTDAMVRVTSGRTHDRLLAHAVGGFFDATWCGDVDGNGTDDLRVSDCGRDYVLGYQRER